MRRLAAGGWSGRRDGAANRTARWRRSGCHRKRITGCDLDLRRRRPGGPRTVVTDDHGGYVLESLPAGRYLVTAVLTGFEPRTTEVDVEGGSATLDLVLAVSSFSETMTVTATKTGAADIQSTPIAVTVLPARMLEQLGIQTVEGLAGVVPTVMISQHTGAAQVTIRGIGTNSTVAGADPSSTVHLDGVYLGRPVMVLMDS